MFFSHTTRVSAVGLVLVIVVSGAALTGCRSGAASLNGSSDAPQIHYERVATPTPTPTPTGVPADRLEEAARRDQQAREALSARFRGIPADRVEEQLAKEPTE